MNKDSAKERVQNLIEKASREDQKLRLKAWSDICEKAISEKLDFSVANLVRQIKNNGFKLTKRTVYNKNNSNLYLPIYEIWSNYKLDNEIRTKPSNTKTTNSDLDGLFNIDINEIKNPVTRYQVSIALGQLKSFKNQLDLATKINNPNALIGPEQTQLEHKEQAKIHFHRFSDYELEIIKEFLNSQFFEFDENGKMFSASSIKKGTSLTSEGFKQALEKVLSD
ncbi:hypothetical protein DS891_18600 [Pseudoalteromonas sp. JC28]|uniref:gamma-mobile-trio protein GmtX n=1 Tax=Pseudoalteromonas sp. JC28 TaxID=2267617 RepID=UPI001573237E|nr:gamma-mobile-trio protein GmtX [Pseudoalteromonas sp. JC28]NSY35545.1 hypothetical protein [Pseudoalteromonas sp. JC28]QWV04841.1 hypothetical protein KQ246_16165 [Pseudoalteromonas shioyasakiensis]